MRKTTISRRDFLKLSAVLTASSFLQPALKLAPTQNSPRPDAKNVLIILFDALSARNINFYGYPRDTMPNLTRLLERAVVYHNHYASSNFTTSGTASLLTGRHVWEHLALKLTSETREEFSTNNIFSYFDDYHKLGFTHNYYADLLLTQFQNALTHHEPFRSQFLRQNKFLENFWANTFFQNYQDTAMLFNSRLTDSSIDGYIYSLVFSKLFGDNDYTPPPEIADNFPLGVPLAGKQDPFILEDAIDWTMEQVSALPQPFLGYFHYLPPHAPYNPRLDFHNTFLDDGYSPVEKLSDPYALRGRVLTRSKELSQRQSYDEFILYADAEFGRLFNHLEQQGILENTILVLTSDHGEMIERGVSGHKFPYLFEPVVKIPLVIFEPGRNQRQDIYTPTSCIDLFPTLLDYTGHPIPNELPGQILPPFTASQVEYPRAIFSHYADNNKDDSHLTTNSLMMRKGDFKVIRYSGYSTLPLFTSRADAIGSSSENYHDTEFLVFDLESDPEELNNLAAQPTSEIQSLIDELERFYRENVEYPNLE